VYGIACHSVSEIQIAVMAYSGPVAQDAPWSDSGWQQVFLGEQAPNGVWNVRSGRESWIIQANGWCVVSGQPAGVNIPLLMGGLAQTRAEPKRPPGLPIDGPVRLSAWPEPV
jgi:hypothetical protein